MQSSLLGAYLTYITLSALTSEPTTADFSCSTIDSTSAFGNALFYIGFILTFVALFMAAFSAGSMTDPGLNEETLTTGTASPFFFCAVCVCSTPKRTKRRASGTGTGCTTSL